MNEEIVIRNETNADVDAITEVTIEAFKTLAVSNRTEQFIVGALRAANALSVSLVAEKKRRVIGHIAFSPVTVSDGAADGYGLGPVSALPGYQRQGVGKNLVREGLRQLKKMGARGCCVREIKRKKEECPKHSYERLMDQVEKRLGDELQEGYK